MTHKVLAMMVIGLFVAAVPGAALADISYSGDVDTSHARMSAESMSTVDADAWPVSGPIETGAVPESGDKLDPNSTHFNPFYPELRSIDSGGGGE
jgi:hypothetical protein